MLRADLPGYPGGCDLSIQVAGGSEYFFEVALRSSYWHATLPGQVMLGIPLLNLLAPAIAYSGMGMETAGKVCGGGFSIVPIERDPALTKLMDLHASQ